MDTQKNKISYILIILMLLTIFIFAIYNLSKAQRVKEKIVINEAEQIDKEETIETKEKNQKNAENSGNMNNSEINNDDSIKYDITEYDDAIMFSGYNNTAIMVNFNEVGVFDNIEYIAFCEDSDEANYLFEQYKKEEGNATIKKVGISENIFTIKYEKSYFTDLIGKTKEEVKSIFMSNEFLGHGKEQ